MQRNTTQMDTHEWIKQALRQSRMSASELARQTGVTRQAVSKWLHPDPKKRAEPELMHLRAIANATGVEYGEAGEDEDVLSRHDHGQKALLMREVMRIVRKHRPDLMPNFKCPVEIPGVRLVRMDYCSRTLALGIVVGAPRAVAWHLALLARLDRQLRNPRQAVLCHFGQTYVQPGELRLLGVEPVPVNSADDIAKVVLDSEPR